MRNRPESDNCPYAWGSDPSQRVVSAITNEPYHPRFTIADAPPGDGLVTEYYNATTVDPGQIATGYRYSVA